MSQGKKALRAVYDLLIEKLGAPHALELAGERGPDDYEDSLYEAFQLAASFKSRATPEEIVSSAWWVYLHPDLLDDVSFDEINPCCQGGAQYELFAEAFASWKQGSDSDRREPK